MDSSHETVLTAILRALRPLSLAASFLFYALGGGIASYLGEYIDWPLYWSGQAMLILLLVSSFFLNEYFDRPGPPFATRTAPPHLDKNENQPAPVPRVIFLMVAVTTLTVGAILTVVLFSQGNLAPPVFLFLGLSFMLAVLYALPPFRLIYSGYGELVIAILMCNLVPALAFSLQAGDPHRMLAMMTFPLTFLFLAALLALSLQSYLDDMKLHRQTMMLRLGWQRGIGLHNILVGSAYILLAFSIIAGLPFRLGFPAFLSLPVSIFQILQINSIAGGAKPRWRILAITAIASVGLAVYFMNFALWTD